MANSNMLHPPVFKDEDMEYVEWRKDIKLWTLLTHLPKSKMAIAVHLSLSGRARKATSELTEGELKAENGIATLLAKLDKVYLQDADWNIFHNYLSFEKFSRTSETLIEDFFCKFDRHCCKLKECGVELPEAVLACRLLRSFDLSDVHYQLVLTTISFLSLDDMRKTLKRLFSHDGIICIPKDNEVPLKLTENIKEEPIIFSEGYQEHYSNNNKNLEGSSSYCEEIIQKEHDKSCPVERESSIGELEQIVVNQDIDEDVENEQSQLYGNRVNVKEEIPDHIDGIEYSVKYFDRFQYSDQDHNLSERNDQETSKNDSYGMNNPVQTSFHDNESIESWLRRNLCSVNIKNLVQCDSNQNMQQNKGNNFHRELSIMERNDLGRKNLKGYQSERASRARKSGRQAKLPGKFKEYVYVPPKKKSHSCKVQHTHSLNEKSIESNANDISSMKVQESQSKISTMARKSGRQAKLPGKFKEYLYVPPTKKSHSPKVVHTQSAKERSLELDMNDISTSKEQVGVNKKESILPEGWRKQKIKRSDVSNRNLVFYYISPSGEKLYTHKEIQLYCRQKGIDVDMKLFVFNSGYSQETLNTKNDDMDDNSTVKESETPEKQDLASNSTMDRKICSNSPDINKSGFSSQYEAKYIRKQMKNMHDVNNHTKGNSCTQCPRSFESEQALSIHLLSHRNPATIGPFICPYCCKEFDIKHSWQRHVYMFHEKDESNAAKICLACKMSFKSNEMFRRHRYKYHREEMVKERIEKALKKKKFKVCPYCDKEILSRRFSQHLKIHKEGRERDYKCPHCDKEFSTKGNLGRHMENWCPLKVYEGGRVRVYICSQCDKGFKTKSHLGRHEKICDLKA